jgi:hypothetical protein
VWCNAFVLIAVQTMKKSQKGDLEFLKLSFQRVIASSVWYLLGQLCAASVRADELIITHSLSIAMSGHLVAILHPPPVLPCQPF